MASLDFYAARNDQRLLLDFLLAETDVRIFEAYSELGAALREFKTTDQLDEVRSVGDDPHGNGANSHLALWSGAVTTAVEVERITLKKRIEGHDHRFKIEGWGLIQLLLGGQSREGITACRYAHNGQARARKWGHEADVDWVEMKRLSGRIQYQTRRRLAVAKLPGRPVLPGAYAAWQAGRSLLGPSVGVELELL